MNYDLNILTTWDLKIVNLTLLDNDTGISYCGKEIIKDEQLKSRWYNNYSSRNHLPDTLKFFSFKLNRTCDIIRILNLNFKQIRNQELGDVLSLMKIEEIVI
jgi:hypothetical protein